MKEPIPEMTRRPRTNRTVSIRQVIGPPVPVGPWVRRGRSVAGVIGWVLSGVIVFIGSFLLWQLLFGDSVGGDVWLGQPIGVAEAGAPVDDVPVTTSTTSTSVTPSTLPTSVDLVVPPADAEPHVTGRAEGVAPSEDANAGGEVSVAEDRQPGATTPDAVVAPPTATSTTVPAAPASGEDSAPSSPVPSAPAAPSVAPAPSTTPPSTPPPESSSGSSTSTPAVPTTSAPPSSSPSTTVEDAGGSSGSGSGSDDPDDPGDPDDPDDDSGSDNSGSGGGGGDGGGDGGGGTSGKGSG